MPKLTCEINGNHEEYTLPKANNVLGRSSECDIVLPVDEEVSRSHCQISQENNDEWTITDLDSTNGTAVNGEKLTPHTPLPLPSGSKILIGTTIYYFEQ